ncbi:MAG: aspartate kinase [Flavobacteriales bacterium]
MKIFKFGGASVKNAEAVRNVASILRRFQGEQLVVVISAMGKTTNHLEKIHQARFQKENCHPLVADLMDFHEEIAAELFADPENSLQLTWEYFSQLQEQISSPIVGDYDQEYDQIVGYGELLSTSMVHAYLMEQEIAAGFIDARRVVKTDNRFRDARVDWNKCALGIEQVKSQFNKHSVVITQGFIGSTTNGLSTTLGREGSDFTAAIMAFLLDAESVTIWKDVPGMLNADPKWFPNTVKLDRISFREAIELAYYGASVIHPKTIKPLQNKGIPLYIKSFIDPEAEGSVIQESNAFDNLVPSFILKRDQVLISMSTKDFSFVVEDNLKEIFDVLSDLGIRVHLMENSALSFSICMDKDDYKQNRLFAQLADRYTIRYNEGLHLVTIRHYDDATLKMLTENKEILLEQRSRQTVRLVMR